MESGIYLGQRGHQGRRHAQDLENKKYLKRIKNIWLITQTASAVRTKGKYLRSLLIAKMYRSLNTEES